MVARPFGALVTAMATPFAADGTVDLEAVAALAEHLVDAGTEGLVVNGTTGESPTTTDAEKADVVRAVVAAVGERAHVVAGVGTNDTAHSAELARQAVAAGAHGLLVVSPYYSRPSQEGLVAHVRAVADAGGLPVMLYDIPGRTGVEFRTETLLRLAEHPHVVAVKDAKGDLQAATRVMSGSDLAMYSGDDGLLLPYLAVGGVGVVGVTTHLAAPAYARMVAAHDAGDVAAAREEHHALQPLVDAVMTRMQGAVAVKVALHALGHVPSPRVRLPLVEPEAIEREELLAAVHAAGLT
ncbi:4-hydroxy-tetrahydrodipicolinate synthase [Aquipuribacter sp. SD81]|uniref:4-hydroxy-tetrahydrodipicolinate synthase n=1 Tax=Aquipuribacter sp. SD81 TaxID=3127703 RepID=UPI00301AF3D4